ncbi:tRNA-U20a,U20b-dihydrouridine synthase [Bacteroides luti]|uniref:tRNA-dihydrouridine synthase n=1 Tax=Bacteroides luti TaxID=1297750 RepID=A0A1M5EY90_9BACE|nr:tRNA-dihydrouridine synthase family protein [Bacteroides luti]SHF84168.1 tRNA-U20a,U20b-dihydrouridine synthase [Bacteroides luti]
MQDEKKIPIHFAPLQGFTDAPYRNAHETIFGGVDTYYTPFVRLEKGESFRNRELRDIEKENNTVHHLVPQLIASTAEEMKKIVALFQEKGYKEADINMGCPFPMLVRRHKGSGILPFPNEVEELLACIQDFPDMTFSVKMRLGLENPEECLALLPLLNSLPLKQIALHARIGKQQYKGETNLNAFETFYNACKHPIIYNGDITTLDDIKTISDRFPSLSGVMIGRGLLSNPALAYEYQLGRTLSREEMYAKVKAFHNSLLSYYEAHLQGNDQLVTKMKTIWEYLLPDMDRKAKKKIHKSTKIETYRTAVSEALK